MVSRETSSGKIGLYEETIRLLVGADVVEVREKAAALGLRLQHSYYNESGQEVVWRFEALLEVQDLCEAEILDGVEVFSTLFCSEQYNKKPADNVEI